MVRWGATRWRRGAARSLLAPIPEAIGVDLRVSRVGDRPVALPWFVPPAVPFNLETPRIALPYSATIAALGLLESLLTAPIVEGLTDTPSCKRWEALGQGVAEPVSRIFGGMGGRAMIGQSVINVRSGGITRLWTPMAVMVMVSVRASNWTSIKGLRSHPSPWSTLPDAEPPSRRPDSSSGPPTMGKAVARMDGPPCSASVTEHATWAAGRPRVRRRHPCRWPRSAA